MSKASKGLRHRKPGREACRVGDFPLGLKTRGEGPGDEPGCVLGGRIEGNDRTLSSGEKEHVIQQ